MQDFDSENTEFNEAGKTSEAPAEISEDTTESKNQADPEAVCGVVYSPASDGSGYSCYSYTDGEPTPRRESAPARSGSRKGSGGKIALVAVLILMCMIFSGLAAFAGMYLASEYRNGDILPAPENSSDVPSGTDKINVNVADVPTDTVTNISTTTVPRGTKMNIVDTVKCVKDSVVEITTETVTTGGFFGQYVTGGAGSGVIISPEGFIITNNHVIEDATTITVRLTDGKKYPATLVGTDKDFDIAVVRIQPEPTDKLCVAVLGNSDVLEVGEDVLVIGNPLGELGGTVTNGIISAKERELTINSETMTLLQTNAAVNPGNSGGGMFNLYGELVGVVNAKSSGENVEGLGFAIPVNTAWHVAEELVRYGYVRGKPTLDVTLVDVSNTYTAYRYFGTMALGVYVYESSENGSLQVGDRILTCNGKEISTASQVSSIIKSMAVGETVQFTVMRAGKTIEVSAVLTEMVPKTNPKK